MRARTRKSTIDTRIEQAYYRHAAGRQINILDIGKVYAAGRAAAAAGGDVDAAVAAAVLALTVPTLQGLEVAS